MPYEVVKVLIWGKTYPELSSKYVETVCTGGCREDGSPIRLYPVPLRYLDTGKQYKLYEWIEVAVEKSRSDPRPESYKVNPDKITRVGHLDTERGTWRSRRSIVFRDLRWQFSSIGALKAAQISSGRSFGIVTPAKIEEVKLVPKSSRDKVDYEAKMIEVQSQGDFFRPEYKELEFLLQDIHLLWRCAESCSECRRKPHNMKVLDWGLLELGRRDGWEKAKRRLEEIANLRTYDFKIFMGNFRLHPQVFGIIGLWYPKIPVQKELFQ
jgi:hypothetical protein